MKKTAIGGFLVFYYICIFDAIREGLTTEDFLVCNTEDLLMFLPEDF